MSPALGVGGSKEDLGARSMKTTERERESSEPRGGGLRDEDMKAGTSVGNNPVRQVSELCCQRCPGPVLLVDGDGADCHCGVTRRWLEAADGTGEVRRGVRRVAMGRAGVEPRGERVWGR